jgi:membrane-associated protein
VFDWLTQLQASPLTYLAVLGACALDAVLPIVPSDAVVIAASVLAVRGELWIWLVAVAAAAGGFLGDTGSYVLGRTAGAAAARRLFRSPKAKGRLTWAGEALDRHGATIIVVARFVPGGRTATTFTAGTVRLPWPSFAAADAVGATLWAAYAAGLSYVGGGTFERRPLYGFLFGLGVALLGALVVERYGGSGAPGLVVPSAVGGRSEQGEQAAAAA